MKIKPLILLFGCCLASAFVSACQHKQDTTETSAPTETSQDLVQKAEGFYAQREDISKLRSGVSVLKQARAADATNYDILWRLSKYEYYMATHPSNDDERDQAFKDGIDAGKAAVKEKDDKPEGHFWLGANYGGSAKTGMLAGLSSVSDIKDQMQAVIKADPSYEGASAYMVLGQLDLGAPKVLGGDVVQAVKDLEQGEKINNQNSMLKFTLAQAYLKNNRSADAKRELDEIEKLTPDKDHIPENKEVLAEVPDLRKQLK